MSMTIRLLTHSSSFSQKSLNTWCLISGWREMSVEGSREAWGLDKAQLSELPSKEEKPGSFIDSKIVVFKTIFVSTHR